MVEHTHVKLQSMERLSKHNNSTMNLNSLVWVPHDFLRLWINFRYLYGLFLLNHYSAYLHWHYSNDSEYSKNQFDRSSIFSAGLPLYAFIVQTATTKLTNHVHKKYIASWTLYASQVGKFLTLEMYWKAMWILITGEILVLQYKTMSLVEKLWKWGHLT
jgi:hypothetical protein